MTISNIDTFEHDIREEIKNKEASIGDIASAGGVVGNTSNSAGVRTNSSRILIILVSMMTLFILAGFGYLGYVYLTGKPSSKEKSAQVIDDQTNRENTKNIISDKLNKISPALSVGIAHFISKVEETPNGTILTLNSYSSVFAFMIKNETTIGSEILTNEIAKYDYGTTTPDLNFSDITKSNQNMRTLSVGSSTIVYAFFREEYLVLASSVESILQIRGAIIK